MYVYVKDFIEVQAYMFRLDPNTVAKNKALAAGKGQVIISLGLYHFNF